MTDPASLPQGDIPISSVALGVVTPMAKKRESVASLVQEVAKEYQRFGFRDFRHFAALDRVITDVTPELLRELARDLPSLQVVFAPEIRSVVDAYMRGYREALAVPSNWIRRLMRASATHSATSRGCSRR